MKDRAFLEKFERNQELEISLLFVVFKSNDAVILIEFTYI